MKTILKILFAVMTICSILAAGYYLYQKYIQNLEPADSDEEAQCEIHKPTERAAKKNYTILNVNI